MNLPEEILLCIINYIPPIERERCRRVCYQWNRIIKTSSDFKMATESNRNALKFNQWLMSQEACKRKQFLKIIDISGLFIAGYDTILHLLLTCENLEYLDCSYNLNLARTKQTENLENLLVSHEKLKVLKAKQGDQQIAQILLQKLPNLTELNMNRHAIYVAYYEHYRFPLMKPHQNLKICKMKNWEAISDAFIQSSPNLVFVFLFEMLFVK